AFAFAFAFVPSFPLHACPILPPAILNRPLTPRPPQIRTKPNATALGGMLIIQAASELESQSSPSKRMGPLANSPGSSKGGDGLGAHSPDQENNEQRQQSLAKIWKLSAAKAADNLLRILEDIELQSLDVTIDETIKESLKSFDSAGKPSEDPPSDVSENGACAPKKDSKELIRKKNEAPGAKSCCEISHEGGDVDHNNASTSEIEHVDGGERAADDSKTEGGPSNASKRETEQSISRSDSSMQLRTAEKGGNDICQNTSAETKINATSAAKADHNAASKVVVGQKQNARDGASEATKPETKSRAERDGAELRQLQMNIRASRANAISYMKSKKTLREELEWHSIKNIQQQQNLADTGRKADDMAQKAKQQRRGKAKKNKSIKSVMNDQKQDRPPERPKNSLKKKSNLKKVVGRHSPKIKTKQPEIKTDRTEQQPSQIPDDVESVRLRSEEVHAAEPSEGVKVGREVREDNQPASEVQRQKCKEQSEVVEKVLQQANAAKNFAYYRVLGVSPSASDGDVKRAYRKLSLKIHPDKNPSDKAVEAFHAVMTAYEVLKSPSKRADYDRQQTNSCITDPLNTQAAQASAPSPSDSGEPPSFHVVPTGTQVTIQSDDSRFAHFNGMQGSVLSYEPRTDLYSVQLGINRRVILCKGSAMFQNIVVCLRAFMAHEFGGVFLVTLSSYWGDAGLYHAMYSQCSGRRMTTLRPQQFIIPNGTVVQISNGRYGTIVDWRESFDILGSDQSYYQVQLSPGVSAHVPMADVYL
ncbi:hypothetical protein ACHAWF_007221, partial [Thalassiosira exigua]